MLKLLSDSSCSVAVGSNGLEEEPVCVEPEENQAGPAGADQAPPMEQKKKKRKLTDAEEPPGKRNKNNPPAGLRLVLVLIGAFFSFQLRRRQRLQRRRMGRS